MTDITLLSGTTTTIVEQGGGSGNKEGQQEEKEGGGPPQQQQQHVALHHHMNVGVPNGEVKVVEGVAIAPQPVEHPGKLVVAYDAIPFKGE